MWLMTDERIVDLDQAIAALPRGAGIVFRHHATPARERRQLFDRVRKAARRSGHVLLLADTPALARAWHADGAHHRSRLASVGLRSVAMHDARELAVARRVGADLVFVSPVFATRTHPGAPSLGLVRTGLMIGRWRGRAIALGGMNATSWKSAKALSLYGWGAIDGLTLAEPTAQKRKAVPT